MSTGPHRGQCNAATDAHVKTYLARGASPKPGLTQREMVRLVWCSPSQPHPPKR